MCHTETCLIEIDYINASAESGACDQRNSHPSIDSPIPNSITVQIVDSRCFLSKMNTSLTQSMVAGEISRATM